jgi:endonuclease/exonuclease/phosphatase family metal-dependent hydrolase
MSSEGSIKFLTWNIHGGVGLDGQRNLPRIIAMVREIGPDVAALQEVDGRALGGSPSPRLAHLMDAIGMHSATAAAISTPDGDYGQVLLSRWPLTAISDTDISVARREPRRLLGATVECPLGRFRVIALHFGLRFSERKAQVGILHQLVEATDIPTVVLGDFNDWLGIRSVRQTLERVLPEFSTLSTFPSRLPFLALDRIYCRPAGILRECHTVRSAALLSDHLPLVGTISLGSVLEHGR